MYKYSVETMSSTTHTRKIMTQIIELIKSWFTPTTYQSELEQFIVSHNPQNTAHIEALEREYSYRLSQQTWAGI